MAGRKEIKAGAAFVELYLKNKLTTQLTTGLMAAKKQLNTMASTARFVGGTFNQLGGIAVRTGGMITGPFLAALANLDESKAMFKEMGDALTEGLGRPLLPILQQVRNVVLAFADWAKENPQLIRQIFLIGVGITAAGAVLMALGAASMVAAAGLSAAATVMGVLAGVVAIVTSPLGLIVALLAGGVAAWVMFTKSGEESFGIFKDIIGDIGTRLLKGDLQGAWDTVVMGMAAVWDTFSAGVLAVAKSLVDAVSELWNNMLNGMLGSLSAIQGALAATGNTTAANAVGKIKSGLGGIGATGSAVLGASAGGVTAAEIGARRKASESMTDFVERISGGGERFTGEIESMVDEITDLFARLTADRGGGAALPPGAELAALGQRSTVTFSGSGLLAAGQGQSRAEGHLKKLAKVAEREEARHKELLAMLKPPVFT